MPRSQRTTTADLKRLLHSWTTELDQALHLDHDTDSQRARARVAAINLMAQGLPDLALKFSALADRNLPHPRSTDTITTGELDRRSQSITTGELNRRSTKTLPHFQPKD